MLSSIFKWFASDFGASEREVVRSLIPFSGPELAGRLKEFTGDIEYDYDWKLNGK